MTAIVSAQEMKLRLVESYLASFRRAGVTASADEIERLAVADLELVDRAERAGEIRSGQPASSAPADRTRSDAVLSEAQRATGTRLTVSDEDTEGLFRARLLHATPGHTSPQWAAAVARLKRILQGAATSGNLQRAVSDGEYSKLAREYVELWGFFLTRSRPAPTRGVDHNPFRGYSDEDSLRIFERWVYDLCDRSTGVLGSWYTK